MLLMLMLMLHCVVLIAEGISSVVFARVFVLGRNQRQKQQNEMCVKSHLIVRRRLL